MAVNGFVHVVESPSGRDLLDGRTEGRLLTEGLLLGHIPHCYSLATDKSMLREAFGSRLRAAYLQHHKPPILHLSMHGNAEGLSLTCGEFLSWHDLRGLLLPLLRAMRGGLLLCMSSCFGADGCRMAMYADDEPPFWALVGNSGSPTWADAAVAYVSFYHLFFKGVDFERCVQSMGVASGDQHFLWHRGAVIRAGWDAFIQQRQELMAATVPEAAAEIEQKGRDS